MNITLWIVQGLLALAFAGAGGMKLFAYDKMKLQMHKKDEEDLSRGLVMFIGVAELAGAVGVILPMATHVAPWLSPLAAAGLATIMLLALVYHARRHEPASAPAILLVLALFVALGRVYVD